jgi:hypothetical protein
MHDDRRVLGRRKNIIIGQSPKIKAIFTMAIRKPTVQAFKVIQDILPSLLFCSSLSR